MKFPRRRFLHLAAAAVALPAVSRIASAQSYPTRHVMLVVPFLPGGAQDAIARLLGHRLSELWDHPVVIENRGGAGGNIAAQTVAQSAPDGYTLLLGTSFLATNPYLYPSVGYDPVADLTPLTLLCVFPNLMVVPNSSPAKSVKEFVDYAKLNRGKITYASPGTGTSVHLAGELFKRMSGIEMTHVPYRGNGPALSDLMSGRVDVMFGTLPSVLPQVQSKTIRGLGVTSASRTPFAADIPTIAESGVPGFDVSAWNALFMPAKTPVEIVNKVCHDAILAFAHPPVRRKLEEIGALVASSAPAELAALLRSEMEKWGPIIKEAGIKAS
jgi:tripartite-type tricarboxylate transporter receptor subunit TctC